MHVVVGPYPGTENRKGDTVSQNPPGQCLQIKCNASEFFLLTRALDALQIHAMKRDQVETKKWTKLPPPTPAQQEKARIANEETKARIAAYLSQKEAK